MTDAYASLEASVLANEVSQLQQDYDLVASNKMSLDLSRGKPAADQLDLSNGLEDAIGGNFLSENGTDVRNYGGLRGLPEARALGAEIMGVPADNVMAGGNSSLTLMHFVVTTALQHGLWGDHRAWNRSKVKLLTPVPGYDRHFVLSEALGIEMVNIDITETGPDMDQARALVAADPQIKGIWCVPKYSNPTGCTYSDQVVDEIAQLPDAAAADDFIVLWDNAYAVHDLVFPGDTLASLLDAADRAQTADHMVQFGSTSKITFAGGGIAFIASSERVLNALEEHMSYQMIGPDKVNQLRHARFLKGRVGQQMQNHAQLIRPKFEIVLSILEEELGALDIATWTNPRGGYFISLDLLPGLATQVIDMAKEVGLTLTPAGATFPHGNDPQDRNVRIAPTFATLDELKAAMRILTLCVKLASAKKLAA
ncbi:MAG: aminotransferase class I/II-fold pyridoxal phosphate-dependent enzyme [Pseudomonadota bacterium]